MRDLIPQLSKSSIYSTKPSHDYQVINAFVYGFINLSGFTPYGSAFKRLSGVIVGRLDALRIAASVFNGCPGL